MDVWKIVIKPHLVQASQGRSIEKLSHVDVFSAHLNGRELVMSTKPLYDSAKLLIEEGANPMQLLTMRHENRDYNSFAPQTLAFWATLEIPKKPKDGSTPRADALAALIHTYPGT